MYYSSIRISTLKQQNLVEQKFKISYFQTINSFYFMQNIADDHLNNDHKSVDDFNADGKKYI